MTTRMVQVRALAAAQRAVREALRAGDPEQVSDAQAALAELQEQLAEENE